MSDKNPGRTPDEEYQDRIEMAYTLLASRWPKHKIKRALMERYGVCARTVENYLSRARDILIAESEESLEEHRAGALAFYTKLIADPEVKDETKLKAQNSIDKLLGLSAPFKVARTDTDGNDIEDARSALNEFDALLAEFAGNASGDEGTDSGDDAEAERIQRHDQVPRVEAGSGTEPV